MKRILLVVLMALSIPVWAQYSPSPVLKQQFFNNNGNPCAGCKLYSFGAGTSSPLATYQDYSGTANTNPVILDSAGRANVWLGPSYYKMELADASGVVIWTVDNISGAVAGGGPFVQYNSDWNSASGPSMILNKPNLATVATSGSYLDLLNLPTIPPVVTLQTNSVDNGSQAKLNLVAGANMSLTDDGAGNITLASAGGVGGSVVLSTNGVNNASQAALNLKNGSNVTVTNTGTGDVQIAATVPTSSSWPNPGTCDAHKFQTSDTNGAGPTCTQPALADLSDASTVMLKTTGLTSSQMPALSGAVTSSAGSTVTHTVTICQIDLDASGSSLASDDARSWECINTFGSAITVTEVDCVKDMGSSTVQIATTGGTNLLSAACAPTIGAPNVCSLNGSPTINNGAGLNATIPTADGVTTMIHCAITGTR